MVDEFCGGFVVVVVVVGSYRVITELFLFRGVGEANGNADSRWPLPFSFSSQRQEVVLSLSLSLSLFCFFVSISFLTALGVRLTGCHCFTGFT